jgi:hypothetical protein
VQRRLGIPAVLAEHVVGPAKQAVVQPHLGQRIQPVADQPDLRFGQQRGVGAEHAPVLPIVLGDPLYVFLGVADERVGNAPGREQIGMYAAWHAGEKPFVVVHLAKFPRAAECLVLHSSSF